MPMNHESDNTFPEPPAVDHTFLRSVRWMGFAEGISTLVLFFIAMPLKYLAEMPLAVRVAGSVHGLLFVGLSLMLLIGVKRIPLSTGFAMIGMVAAVVPFGPFVYDRWLAEKAEA
jgi:integral membrane protein